MLEITPAQMAAMERYSERRFREKLLALLCEQFPQHAADPTAIAPVVELAVEDARDAGLRSERGIAAYVIAAFVLGLDIKDDPHFIAKVVQSGNTEAEKVDWMEGWVTAVAEALEG